MGGDGMGVRGAAEGPAAQALMASKPPKGGAFERDAMPRMGGVPVRHPLLRGEPTCGGPASACRV